LDDDFEYVIDNKQAMRLAPFYETLIKIWFFSEWEVEVNINDKIYRWLRVNHKITDKWFDDDSKLTFEYQGDWYELWWWVVEIEVIWDYDEWWDELMKYAAESLIDDMTYVIYKNIFQVALLKKVIFRFNDKKKWQYEYTDWVVTHFKWETKWWIITDSSDFYQEVLLHEWLQWYWNTKDLVYKEWWQEVPIHIWQNYKINYQWEELTLYDMYTPQIRLAMLRWLYTEEQIAEAKKKWTLKTLQKWQYNVVKDFWHVNVLAVIRRGGKTFLSSLLAVRELLRENYNPKPTRILYYGLSDKKTKTAIEYLLSLTKDFRKFKMFQRRQWEKTLSFIDPETKDPLGSIEFHSAQEDEAWVGEYADMIIIDEASRFPEHVYDAMKAIVFSEWAKAFIISTINWDTSKNWFYQELLKAERENLKRKKTYWEYIKNAMRILKDVNNHWYDYFLKHKAWIYQELTQLIFEYKRYVAWRVTIDEVDRMPDYKKKALINEIKSNPLRYYTEVYCIYPSENKVFNYETWLTNINKDEVLHNRKYAMIYVWYDPALTSDNAGIVSVWIYRDDLWKLKFEIFDAEFIEPSRWMRYKEQVKYVMNIVNQYKQYTDKVYLAVDATWVGTALIEDFEDIWWVDFPIKYISWWNIRRERWVWLVPKELMVITVRNMFDEWLIKVNKSLKELLSEMDYFKKRQTSSWNNKYEAEVWHDDLVNAMMISLFSWYELDALKNEVYEEKQEDIIKWITYEVLDEMKREAKLKEQRLKRYKETTKFLSKYWY